VTARTRVILADDHPIVLGGLRNLIRAENDFDLVGEAAAGHAALRLIRETKPDIAVLDVSMPEMNGIVLTTRVAAEIPSVRVLMLTFHEDRAYVKQALDAGVCGYVLKRSAAEILVQAIRAVMTGGLYVDPAIAHRLFDSGPKRPGRHNGGMLAFELTQREAEALKLAALGFTTKEIARQLDIGIKSVETYKARGLEKLGLKTRAELVRYASTQGWLADI
jgi:DNA-binding NarL/FixJ family response regulator